MIQKVTIDASRVILIGGVTYSSNTSSRTFLYDFNLQTWAKGPELLNGRRLHACSFTKYEVDVGSGSGSVFLSYHVFVELLNYIWMLVITVLARRLRNVNARHIFQQDSKNI